MIYLYLDESGDLGFDFANKKPSRHFTVCLLVMRTRESFLHVGKAVRKTRRHKMSAGNELKGSSSSLSTKAYFWKQVKGADFGIFSVTLDKQSLMHFFQDDQERLYNFAARRVLEHIALPEGLERIQVVIDKSKGKQEIERFNEAVVRQLQTSVDLRIPINIDHLPSHTSFQLQAVDLFSYGIFRSYERQDAGWLDMYRGKVVVNELLQ